MLSSWLVLVAMAVIWGLVTSGGGSAAAAGNRRHTDTKVVYHKGPIDAQMIYLEECASCHGVNGHGSARAPSLVGVGEAAVDWELTTGRMPKKALGHKIPPYTPVLPNRVIQALDSYVTKLAAHGGPPIPKVNAAAGSIGMGGELFREYCAACHNFAGIGGELTSRQIPELQQATPRQVAEAVRFGPFQMPKFGIQAINQKGLDAVAHYVLYMQHPDNRGGNALGYLEPFTSGAITWIIAIPVLLWFMRVMGKRANASARR